MGVRCDSAAKSRDGCGGDSVRLRSSPAREGCMCTTGASRDATSGAPRPQARARGRRRAGGHRVRGEARHLRCVRVCRITRRETTSRTARRRRRDRVESAVVWQTVRGGDFSGGASRRSRRAKPPSRGRRAARRRNDTSAIASLSAFSLQEGGVPRARTSRARASGAPRGRLGAVPAGDGAVPAGGGNETEYVVCREKSA